MDFGLITVVLALIALGVLIVIHELGHYWMAKRVGMKVEVFSVGFGKPLISWQRGDEQWQIGWFPFGGYVKIAGMSEPSSGEGSFFSKSPWDRIKVAFMGPLVNLVFAFLIFSLIWVMGGQVKSSAELTPTIGWIDPQSEVFSQGLRPGDVITTYGGEPFKEAKDHLYAAMLGGDEVEVQGYRLDYSTGTKESFQYKLKPYRPENAAYDDVKTLGIAPANSLIYQKTDAEVYKEAPIVVTGIEDGDRLIWAEGHRLFSIQQLKQLLNEKQALLTIERDGKTMLARVPRVQVEDVRTSRGIKEEFSDWQYAANLSSFPLSKLWILPYDLTPDAVVESRLKLIDDELEKETFPEHPFSSLEKPLLPGDRILGVDGNPVFYSSKLFEHIQKHPVHLIVQRNSNRKPVMKLDTYEQSWIDGVDLQDLGFLANQIGNPTGISNVGNLHLLKPVTPLPLSEFPMSDADRAEYQAKLQELINRIEEIPDPEVRTKQEEALEKQLEDLLLGAVFVDQQITYNPNPFTLFTKTLGEFWRTISALFTGDLSPKWLAGPIGIVAVMQQSWQVSIFEGLFWIGFISLNLGILNLLPIPVLDGGYICIFFYEMLTGRKVQPKALEKLILPFVFLLIGFFLYVTYHDLSRLFDWLR